MSAGFLKTRPNGTEKRQEMTGTKTMKIFKIQRITRKDCEGLNRHTRAESVDDSKFKNFSGIIPSSTRVLKDAEGTELLVDTLLSKRPDVINKGVLRLMRRFFKDLFLNSCQLVRKRSAYQRLKQFKSKIFKIVENLVQSTPTDDLIQFGLLSVQESIGRIVETSLYSRLPKSFKSEDTEEIKEFIKTFEK